MRYAVYPYSTEESATVYDDPVAYVEHDTPPTELTHELFAEVFFNLVVANLKQGEEAKYSLQDVLKWSDDKIAFELHWGDLCYDFDSLALIPFDQKLVDTLKAVGSALGDTMGDDSSCYKAAAVWANVLESHTDVLLSLPMAPDDEPNE